MPCFEPYKSILVGGYYTERAIPPHAVDVSTFGMGSRLYNNPFVSCCLSLPVFLCAFCLTFPLVVAEFDYSRLFSSSSPDPCLRRVLAYPTECLDSIKSQETISIHFVIPERNHSNGDSVSVFGSNDQAVSGSILFQPVPLGQKHQTTGYQTHRSCKGVGPGCGYSQKHLGRNCRQTTSGALPRHLRICSIR